MAKTSTVNLNVTIQGDGINTSYAPPGAPIVNTAAPAGGPITISLAMGDNTLVVPPGALGVIIVPPAISVVVKALKGAVIDTGLIISPTRISGPIGLPAGATSLIINASAPEDITVQWI